MLQSRRSICEIITEEVTSGIPANRVLLGGFSQGGAMTLLTGLTSDYKLAGLAVLSGWLPLKAKFKAVCYTDLFVYLPISLNHVQMAREGAASTNIFWGYGSADPVVKPQAGRESVEFLQNVMKFQTAKNPGDAGLKCEVYKGIGHTTNLQELKDLETFLQKSLPKV